MFSREEGEEMTVTQQVWLRVTSLFVPSALGGPSPSFMPPHKQARTRTCRHESDRAFRHGNPNAGPFHARCSHHSMYYGVRVWTYLTWHAHTSVSAKNK